MRRPASSPELTGAHTGDWPHEGSLTFFYDMTSQPSGLAAGFDGFQVVHCGPSKLLQLDSYPPGATGPLDWCWGDAGVLYFWIRDQDLRELRFDRTWIQLQCG